MSVEHATDYTTSKLVHLSQEGFVSLRTSSGAELVSLPIQVVFRLQRGYEKVANNSEIVLTTQKVSHPPVNPKYGAFRPARPLWNTAMAQGMLM